MNRSIDLYILNIAVRSKIEQIDLYRRDRSFVFTVVIKNRCLDHDSKDQSLDREQKDLSS